jgi:hypothetical protein
LKGPCPRNDGLDSPLGHEEHATVFLEQDEVTLLYRHSRAWLEHALDTSPDSRPDPSLGFGQVRTLVVHHDDENDLRDLP